MFGHWRHEADVLEMTLVRPSCVPSPEMAAVQCRPKGGATAPMTTYQGENL